MHIYTRHSTPFLYLYYRMAHMWTRIFLRFRLSLSKNNEREVQAAVGGYIYLPAANDSPYTRVYAFLIFFNSTPRPSISLLGFKMAGSRYP